MDSSCIKQTVCKVLNIFQYGKYLVAYVLNVRFMGKVALKYHLPSTTTKLNRRNSRFAYHRCVYFRWRFVNIGSFWRNILCTFPPIDNWLCDQNYLDKLSSPYPKESPCKFEFMHGIFLRSYENILNRDL